MSRIDQLFTQLRADKRKAFIPFITAGDPNMEVTQMLLQRLDQLGCSMAEIGIPYSDPIADGPVIQASYTRALNNKIKLSQIFASVASTAPKLNMPLATMVSYAIIYRHGIEAFVDQAMAAGFCGAIVPDLLIEEADRMSEICRQRDFNLIQLVTPTTPRERALRIAESSSGFLYFVSVTGITGTRSDLPPELVDQVGWLKERTDLPICIGFGISQPHHIEMLAPVADGFIVGSAIVKHFEGIEQKGMAAMQEGIDALVRSLLAATESIREPMTT